MERAILVEEKKYVRYEMQVWRGFAEKGWWWLEENVWQ